MVVSGLSRCQGQPVDGGIVRVETPAGSGVLSKPERELLVARTLAIREWPRLCLADERALETAVETQGSTTTGRNATDFCGYRPDVIPVIGLAPLFDVLRALGKDGG